MSDRVLKWGLIVLGAITLLMAAWGVYMYRKYTRLQDAHATTSLDLTNARAASDTTRFIQLRDSVTVYQKLAIQERLAKDDIDKQLGLQRIALQQLTATVRGLQVRAGSTDTVYETAEGLRRATFDVREVPYTARAEVALPATGRGTIDLSVKIDPIPLTARPACSEPDERGIRSASLSVQTPPWAVVRIDSVVQDPSLCRSPAIERRDARSDAKRDQRPRLAVVAGYGVTLFQLEQRAFIGLAVAQPIPLPRWLPFH
jgi:hypothetical protein